MRRESGASRQRALMVEVKRPLVRQNTARKGVILTEFHSAKKSQNSTFCAEHNWHLAPVRSWGILPQEFTYTHGLLANSLTHCGRSCQQIGGSIRGLIVIW
jgi:hypothetical protein